MVKSQGSQSELRIGKQTALGTPQTALVELPFTSHNLSLQKTLLESGDIRSDRMVQNARHGNRSTSGETSFELRAADFDNILESAFFETINTGVLKNGATESFLTIEDAATDISEYSVYEDCLVSNFNMSIAPNQMVNCTASIVGTDMTHQAVTSDADTTITAASGNEPFDSYNVTILEGGGAASASVSAIDLSIDNGANPAFEVGSAEACGIETGRSRVSGTLTVYYENEIMIDKFINETESSLSIALTDGTNTYTFLLPRVKYNGADHPVQSEQSRFVTLPFIALRDDTEAASIKLTIS